MQEMQETIEQSINKSKSNTYIIIRIDETYYGINSDNVVEMVQVDNIMSLPDSPDYIMGITMLRDKVFPVLDLRKRFGLKTLTEETDEMLDSYEKAHVDWLKELESSIEEEREFKLARNHHKCKFGVWYDQYKSNDMIINNFLKNFNDPHKKIHRIANQALKFVEDDQMQKAKDLIEHTHNTTLKEMISLFAGLKKMVKERMKTLAVIMNVEENLTGVNVDNIHLVQEILPENLEDIDGYMADTENSGFLDSMAKINVNGKERVVMILNPESIDE